MTSRRVFLSLLASAPLRAKASPIRSIETFRVDYPTQGRFRFFRNGVRFSVFVKVTCEDGSSGWGQSVPMPTWSYETPESVVTAIREYMAPALIGRDSADIQGAHRAMNAAISPSFSTGMPIAKAGIDLALHDLIRQPLAAFWKRTPLKELTLSWTVNPATLEDTEKSVEEGKRLGYRHFNVKLAPDPKFDIEMCRIVRRLAPNAFFWGDANGGYQPEQALAVAPKLADLGMNVFEQPVAANRLTAFRDLKKLGAIPILMDEGVVSSVELREFIALGLLDGIAMKPARTGGLFDARRQIELARENGLMVLGSGLTDPDLSLAASLQLYAAYGISEPCALNGPQFLSAVSYLQRPLAARSGAIAVPAGSGLGVEVKEDDIRARAAR
ncbi:MAG: enolase C-terminal domain-like protein [Bryobacteraceae bacterium]|nr:enolase C-terminal domain-like protein [Bryobacteraceae bacterium]